MIEPRDDDRITSEAMDWVLRREAGCLSATEAEAFEAWLSQSPAHRERFASTETFWTAAAQLGTHPRMAEKRQWAAAAADRTRHGRRAIAAGLAALVLCLGGAALLIPFYGPRPLATQAFSTAVGQQATVSLPDGSIVTLNTNTRVRTVANDNKRLVYLDKGQAFFKVAKDRRHPFVVSAGGRTVTAVGTAFEIRLDKGAFKVVLVEGRVRVEAAPPVHLRPAGHLPTPPVSTASAPIATDMSAGSQLVASNDADWRVTRVNVTQETSWLKGKLIFDDEALGDVVAELNRYTPRKMVVADDQLAERRISGVYTPGDVQAFTLALRDAKVADVRDGPDGQIKIIPLR
jgi:transmembrane sensor